MPPRVPSFLAIPAVLFASVTTTALATPPGAFVPWVAYEAADAVRQGELLASTTRGEIASEAVSRRCVRLAAPGDHLEWTLRQAANALVLRHSIPDGAAGDGTTATLGLWVNGRFRQKLALESKHAWLYGPKENGQENDPAAAGDPHRFFDEIRAFITGEPLRPGDRLRLQIDDGDTASWYVVDVLDLELVPPPAAAPAGSLSVADFGAIPDDSQDDTDAIVAAVAEARKTGASVWLPSGTFHQTREIELPGVSLAGAGPWHTRLAALGPATEEMGFPGNCGFRLAGEKNRVRDLLIEGNTTRRGKPRQHAFSGGGTDFLIENVWVDRVKTGLWIGAARDGVIRGCRIRNTYADGINLNSATSRVTVEHTHLRNTGDDALAAFSNSNSRGAAGPCADIVFRHNTVESVWWAHGVGIYGGSRIVVENNLVRGITQAPGIKVAASSFHGHKDWEGDDIRISGNLLVDCGGTSWKQEWGGLWLYLSTGDLRRVLVADNRIVRAGFDGVKIQGTETGGRLDATFARNEIVAPGGDGILVAARAKGSLRLEANTFSGLGAGRRPVVNHAAADDLALVDDTPAPPASGL